MDELIGILAAALFAFLLGVVLGSDMNQKAVAKDCKTMQQFRNGEVVFDCKERSK